MNATSEIDWVQGRLIVFQGTLLTLEHDLVDWPGMPLIGPLNIELYLNVGLMWPRGATGAPLLCVPHRHADSYRKHTPTDIL